ncbi:hypothetical protein EV356DRAFT_501950 [Viridothelium virens]|uniref:Uncharacterized protein n=1 Tax=Viridothelium virens TaxID=1048519 RepID=A0A6A6H8C9_VIRVR|nr:hypothetical protein EV356DRAFT_501950 [Viridothelium virens]
MFENFSFEAAPGQSSSASHEHSYPPHDTSTHVSPHPSRCVSPTRTSFAQPLQYSISDLSRQFGEHSIRPRTVRADSGYESQRSSIAQEESNVASRVSSLQVPQSSSRQPSVKRAQRQDSIRLQTETSHLREISSLVQRMVDSGDQCSLCRPTSSHSERSNTPPEDDDDVVSMGLNTHESAARRHNLPYRRSNEVLRGRPGVTKDVRMRKSRSRLNMNANNMRRS